MKPDSPVWLCVRASRCTKTQSFPHFQAVVEMLVGIASSQRAASTIVEALDWLETSGCGVGRWQQCPTTALFLALDLRRTCTKYQIQAHQALDLLPQPLS
ncbi:hypothetical protein H0G86_001036 [Trichoderma simmonsii]|uniref:Uncharacterized protein n=1 Tax=Trichoderma simmonsii TaxID=1491479 RepID=A0A8G0L0T5_9HYPO|nr:hypothetical protein H0G86_001036 [Trichoderma simmonsii]